MSRVSTCSSFITVPTATSRHLHVSKSRLVIQNKMNWEVAILFFENAVITFAMNLRQTNVLLHSSLCDLAFHL